jgi:hypothetical protein
MKNALWLAMPGLLITSACGSKTVELSDDPIARAATCGVAEAAQARVDTPDIKAPLAVDAQGRILRYAVLAGVEGDSFSMDRASEVIQRMPKEAETLLEGNRWKKVIGPCATAFPAPPAGAPVLPEDPATAGMGCDMMRQFVGKALATAGQYEDTMRDYSKLEEALDKKLAPLMAARGLSDETKGLEAKRKAMAVFAKLGNPTQVMDACVKKYTS